MLWRIIFLLCILFRDVTTTTDEFFLSKRMVINKSITLHCVFIKQFTKQRKCFLSPTPTPQKKKKKKKMDRYFIDTEMEMKAIFRSLKIGLCMFHLITKYGESHEQIPLIYNRRRFSLTRQYTVWLLCQWTHETPLPVLGWIYDA